MATIHRARAVLKVDRRITAQVLRLAKLMDKGLGDHPDLFPAPSPPLPIFEAQIERVEKLEVLVGAGGLASARNVERDALMGMMDSERFYVQSIADTCGYEQSIAVIQAAGLTVAGVTSYSKPILTVRQGPVPGSVELDAYAAAIGGPRGRMRYFNWQWSGDGGGSWHDLRATPHANTDVPGLALMSTYSFRVSVTIGRVTGAWSHAVSLLVH